MNYLQLLTVVIFVVVGQERKENDDWLQATSCRENNFNFILKIIFLALHVAVKSHSF